MITTICGLIIIILIIVLMGLNWSCEEETSEQPQKKEQEKPLYKNGDLTLLNFPTEKELVYSFCFKNKDKLFSNQDIFNEIKNIRCYVYSSCSLGYINEKMMAAIIISMQKNGVLNRNYYLVNGEEIKLLSVTSFGIKWLEEWQNKQKKN